jgi:hypothetical protein
MSPLANPEFEAQRQELIEAFLRLLGGDENGMPNALTVFFARTADGLQARGRRGFPKTREAVAQALEALSVVAQIQAAAQILSTPGVGEFTVEQEMKLLRALLVRIAGAGSENDEDDDDEEDDEDE